MGHISPPLKTQGQKDYHEFEAHLVYIVEFQASQGYTVKPCLNKTKSKTR